MELGEACRALILGATGAKEVVRATRVQTLWGGYGTLARVELADGPPVVVKLIQPPRQVARGDVGHARKLRSYEVERAFYARHAAHLGDPARVARRIAAGHVEGGDALVLEDLDHAGFPGRTRARSGEELLACLRWLAGFHARFMGSEPEGLWAEGSYWHLATRTEELAALGDAQLSRRARELDRALSDARHRTLVHGDAKPANFCFSADGRRVAAVDFQYVGGGCGMRDVAYLLHGEVGGRALARHLDVYFETLRAALPETSDGDAIERTWRELYPVARDDFERFLVGWRP